MNYVDENNIPGDIVECGVFRGANPMLVKELRRGRPYREIFLFDTFEGMTPPTQADIRHDGASATYMLEPGRKGRDSVLAYCSLDEVKRNFTVCGLDLNMLRFVKGAVEQTLLDETNLPTTISVLRLDTDWYESTKIEMEVLYPRLSPGGVLIIDDYGCWQGSRRAVDEYFAGKKPLLTAVDSECRVAVHPGKW